MDSLLIALAKSSSEKSPGDGCSKSRSYSLISTGIFELQETQCKVPLTFRWLSGVPDPLLDFGSYEQIICVILP